MRTFSVSDMVTWLLMLGSVAPAWFAWRRVSCLGTKLPRWNRIMQRLAVTGLVYLGFFGTCAAAAWKLGVSLPMRSDIAWFPPGMLVWAAISYAILRVNTWKEIRDEKPS